MWYVTLEKANWIIRNCVTGKTRVVGPSDYHRYQPVSKVNGKNYYDAAVTLATERNAKLGVTPKTLLHQQVFGEPWIEIDARVRLENNL